MAGELTRAAIEAQPDWLSRLQVDLRLPEGDVLYTGCGTSFHAAMSGGRAVQALELVLAPERYPADLLVVVSHEGETPMTLEAAQAFAGPKWCVTGAADKPIPALCEEVVVTTPEVEKSYCHTASYTCAVAALSGLRGEDVSWLPAAVAEAIAQLEAAGLTLRTIGFAGVDDPDGSADLKLAETAAAEAPAVAASIGAPVDQKGDGPVARRLQMGVGKSLIIDLPEDAGEIFVGDVATAHDGERAVVLISN